ncbi:MULTISPECIES: DUF6397 family protein [Streptomyces]|uniref:DUF6397 family protein n=1 Tax=Streptomyces TaxID=1883 RepID=UPI00186AFC65|nr:MULTISPECIES: DUF6397 family protein [Streptomyces]
MYPQSFSLIEPTTPALARGHRPRPAPTAHGTGVSPLPWPARPTVTGRATLTVGPRGRAAGGLRGRAAAAPRGARAPVLPRLPDHPRITRVPPGPAALALGRARAQLIRHRPWRSAPGLAAPSVSRPGRRERGGPPRARRVPHRPSLGRRFPHRPVGASVGAELLGISTARFSRLAKGGCFSPCEFLLTEHGVIAWRYPPVELLALARRRPALLTGALPEGLRHTLRQGQDWRPRRWRARRTGLLVGQAAGPWEAAAVPAAVLPLGALRESVPDPAERAALCRLRPPLVAAGLAAGPWRTVRRLLTAQEPDESGWYRQQLAAALRLARRRPLPLLTAGPRPSP